MEKERLTWSSGMSGTVFLVAEHTVEALFAKLAAVDQRIRVLIPKSRDV